MDSKPLRRRISVAVKLHRSAAKLKSITLSDSTLQAPQDANNTEDIDGERPVWTGDLPLGISGYTNADRAQTLDGGFFEDFTILDYKHSDQIKEAEQEARNQDKSLDRTSEVHVSGGSGLGETLSKEETEALYTDLIHIVKNQLGKRVYGADSITDGDLYVYAQEVLGVDKEQHRRLYGIAKQKKALDSYIKVIVKEAQDLEAKDANGLSDPYCMLSLITIGTGDKPSKDGKKVKKTVLRDFSEEILVRTTRIKLNTLNPVWDENFLFKIQNIQKEALRVDVWDHDDDTVFLDQDNQITSIRGFSGVGRFLKEVIQGTKCNESTMDDFLGLIEVPLKDIPSTGLDDWFGLKERSSKSHIQGKLHIKIELIGSAEADPTGSKVSVAPNLKVRRQLWERFLMYESRKYFEEEKDAVYWNGKISPQADCLLTQHATQSGLSKFQKLVCEWEVMSKCQKDVPIPMDTFVDLAARFKIYSACQDLDLKEERIFVDSLDTFVEDCYRLLGKYRDLYPATIPERCTRLGNMLLCLMTLYKLPIFQNYFPERRLVPDLEDALKRSTRDWFSIVEAEYEPNQQIPFEELSGLVKLTNAMSVDLTRASNYESLFKTIGIDYYTFTYNEIETMIVPSVKPRVLDLIKKFGYGLENDNVGTAMFELYISLRDLTEHKDRVPEGFRNENGIEEYHTWFKGAVVKWLDLAKQKALVRIKRAVDIDEVRVVHTMLKYSASAVDVTCCLGQICTFWKNLHWPEPSGAYAFVVQIVDILSTAAMEYGQIVLEKLNTVGYYDTVGQFDITEKLCICLNNLEHVLTFMDTIPSILNFNDVIMEICNVHGSDRDSGARATLMDVLECAKIDVKDKLDKVIVRIGDKMRPSILGYLDDIVQKARSVEDFEAVDPLLDYLDQNLITLNEAILESVFDRMLIHFWEVVLFSLENYVTKADKGQKKRFAILSLVLEEVRTFFRAGGQGVAEELLHSKTEQSIEHMLYLYGAPTEIVIQKYYVEKAQEQARASERFGALEFKVFYSQQNQALHISIIHASKLLPLDKTGSSDPFVCMELMPKHIFPNQTEQRTTVKKQTLFPVFDENFSFEIPSSKCLQDGATLVLTVYDYDMVSDNDIAGEIFYDLNNVLGLEDEISGGFACIGETDMPLIHGSLTGQPYRVLQDRTDSLAVNFLQQRNAKVRKMTDDVIRGRKISLSIQ